MQLRLLGCLSVVVILIVVLSIPFKTVDVPEWKVRVVDQNNEPLPGLTVNESWKNYSLDLEPSENGEERQTDSNGYAVFPERRSSASVLRRTVNSVLSAVATIIAHGSIGIHARLMVREDPSDDNIKSWKPGEPLPTEIVVPQ